jgi:hypothetical protein
MGSRLSYRRLPRNAKSSLSPLPADVFQAAEKVFDQVEQLVSAVKSAQPAPGHDKMFLPGEKARHAEAQRPPRKTFSQLGNLGVLCGREKKSPRCPLK